MSLQSYLRYFVVPMFELFLLLYIYIYIYSGFAVVATVVFAGTWVQKRVQGTTFSRVRALVL